MIPGSATPNAQVGVGAKQRTIRNAFRHDFDVGFEGDAGVFRFAFHYKDAKGIDRIQVGETQDFAECSTSPFLNTEELLVGTNDGKQFQPTLDYALRSDPVSSPLEWQLAYLSTTFVVDPTDHYVAPWGTTIGSRTVGGVSVPAFTGFHPLAPLVLPQGGADQVIEWYSCPNSEGYWGDYFGLTQMWNPVGFDLAPVGFWQNVAAFTDSRPAPELECTNETSVLGSPQHLSSNAWVSTDFVP